MQAPYNTYVKHYVLIYERDTTGDSRSVFSRKMENCQTKKYRQIKGCSFSLIHFLLTKNLKIIGEIMSRVELVGTKPNIATGCHTAEELVAYNE